MDDGSIAYDGQADLYDVNGNLIYKTQSRGLEGSLVEILYGKNATPEEVEKVRDLLESSFEHTTKSDDLTDRNQWYWNVDSNHGKVIDVSKYEEIYNTRVLVDSITGQADTIRNLNPRTIYNKMVADGTMDKKSGDSVRSRLARMELRVEKDPITVESLEFYENADGGYISYEEFKANNFITGDRPKYEVNSPVPEGSVISTVFGASGTSAAGTMKTHAGIDFAVESGTEVYPMLVNDKTTVLASNIGEEWLTQIQGNNIILESKFSYTYKGSTVSDNIYQSYDHLESSTLENNDVVGSNTLLGLSGATGKWNGKGYGAHLHVDLYTSLPTSPLLNYINMSYDNKIVDSLVHQSSLNKIAMQYYDPYALLKDYKYKIREDAYSY